MDVANFLSNAGLGYQGYTQESERLNDRARLLRQQGIQDQVANAKNNELLQQAADNQAYRDAAMMQNGVGDASQPTAPITAMQAIAKTAMQRGDVGTAMKYQDAVKKAEQEGFSQLITGALQGKSSEELTSIYNSNGTHRARSIAYDPTTDTLSGIDESGVALPPIKAKQVALAFGITKTPKFEHAPEGSVIYGQDGNVVYNGSADKALREDKRMEREYGFKASLERLKSTLDANNPSAANVPANLRMAQWLMEEDPALSRTQALEKVRQLGSSPEKMAAEIYMTLKKDITNSGVPDQDLRKQAEDVAGYFHDRFGIAGNSKVASQGQPVKPNIPSGVVRGTYKGQAGHFDPTTKKFYPD